MSWHFESSESASNWKESYSQWCFSRRKGSYRGDCVHLPDCRHGTWVFLKGEKEVILYSHLLLYFLVSL